VVLHVENHTYGVTCVNKRVYASQSTNIDFVYLINKTGDKKELRNLLIIHPRLIMAFTHNGSFYSFISNCYGFDVSKLMKSWVKTRMDICRNNQQLIFLLRCRRFMILPAHIFSFKTHITFNSYHIKHQSKRCITHFQNFTQEIKDINFHLRFLRSSLYMIERKLFELLPSFIVLNFF